MATAAAVIAVAVTFCAASQDLAGDAYRTDLLGPDERAAGTIPSTKGSL